MARNTNILGPAGACNVCGKTCCTLDQVGHVCYHCRQGEFLGRSNWRWWDCPSCARKPDPFCDACEGRGQVPVARE